MATLILLNKTELPKGTPSEALVAVWDKGSVPDGQISIPVELNERLLPIRDEPVHVVVLHAGGKAPQSDA